MNPGIRPGIEGPGQVAEDVDELRELLTVAAEENLLLEGRLMIADQRTTQLEEMLRGILASTSWRLTAPLRTVRAMLGAPQGIDETLALASGCVDAEGRTAPDARPADWDSLIPEPLPAGVLVENPDQVEKSNDPCILVRPECTLSGLVPDAVLSPGWSGNAVEGALYYGNQASPARIAFVGRGELATELAFDAAVTRLTEANWEEQLLSASFDLLLVDPCWHVDNRDWRNAMFAEGRGRPALERLLERAAERGIPRVLWFRMPQSDIGHFSWLVSRADAAYAATPEIADALAERCGRPVATLPVAIQPALHNPLRSWEQLAPGAFSDRVLYDGWLDLQEGAGDLPLLRELAGSRLLVAESEWEFGGVRLLDNPAFKRNALGCLTFPGKAALSRMVGAEIYRRSPLIADWHRQLMIMRSLACGSPCVEMDTEAVLGDGLEALTAKGTDETLSAFLQDLLASPLKRDRLRHEAFRSVMGAHCIADRLDRIAIDLGLPARFVRPPATIACLLVTMRPELLESCIERFRADRYQDKELVIVLHGRQASLQDARRLVRSGERISIYQMGKQYSLGECLNFAAAQADAEYWAKVDDDDLYGPNYLSDIMLYRKAFDFPVAGKTAAFTYLQLEDEIRWDPILAATRAWQYRRPQCNERVHIAGGTLVGKRSVLEEVPFSDVRRRGSDAHFLKRADAAGYPFLGLDYFNFALFRSGTPGFHTWNMVEEELRERGLNVGRRGGYRITCFHLKMRGAEIDR